MDTATITSLVAIAVALITAIPVIISLFAQRKRDKAVITKEIEESKKIREETEKVRLEAEKIKADTEEKTVQTALSLITPLKDRIVELECELKGVMEDLRTIERLLAEKDKIINDMKEREEENIAVIEDLKKNVALLKYELRECNERKNTPPE